MSSLLKVSSNKKHRKRQLSISGASHVDTVSKRFFEGLDDDQDGKVFKDEFTFALSDINPDLSDEEAEVVFSQLDQTSKGFITLEDFRLGFDIFIDSSTPSVGLDSKIPEAMHLKPITIKTTLAENDVSSGEEDICSSHLRSYSSPGFTEEILAKLKTLRNPEYLAVPHATNKSPISAPPNNNSSYHVRSLSFSEGGWKQYNKFLNDEGKNHETPLRDTTKNPVDEKNALEEVESTKVFRNDELQADLREEINKKEDEIRILESKLSMNDHNASFIKQHINDMEIENDQLRNQVLMLEKEMQKKEKDLKDSIQRIDIMSKDNEYLNEKLKILGGTSDIETKESLKNKIRKSEEVILSLKNDLNEIQKDYDDMQEEVSLSRRLYLKRRIRQTSLLNCFMRSVNHMKEKISRIPELEDKCDILFDRIDELENIDSAKSAMITQLQRSASEMTDGIPLSQHMSLNDLVWSNEEKENKSKDPGCNNNSNNEYYERKSLSSYSSVIFKDSPMKPFMTNSSTAETTPNTSPPVPALSPLNELHSSTYFPSDLNVIYQANYHNEMNKDNYEVNNKDDNNNNNNSNEIENRKLNYGFDSPWKDSKDVFVFQDLHTFPPSPADYDQSMNKSHENAQHEHERKHYDIINQNNSDQFSREEKLMLGYALYMWLWKGVAQAVRYAFGEPQYPLTSIHLIGKPLMKDPNYAIRNAMMNGKTHQYGTDDNNNTQLLKAELMGTVGTSNRTSRNEKAVMFHRNTIHSINGSLTRNQLNSKKSSKKHLDFNNHSSSTHSLNNSYSRSSSTRKKKRLSQTLRKFPKSVSYEQLKEIYDSLMRSNEKKKEEKRKGFSSRDDDRFSEYAYANANINETEKTKNKKGVLHNRTVSTPSQRLSSYVTLKTPKYKAINDYVDGSPAFNGKHGGNVRKGIIGDNNSNINLKVEKGMKKERFSLFAMLLMIVETLFHFIFGVTFHTIRTNNKNICIMIRYFETFFAYFTSPFITMFKKLKNLLLVVVVPILTKIQSLIQNNVISSFFEFIQNAFLKSFKYVLSFFVIISISIWKLSWFVFRDCFLNVLRWISNKFLKFFVYIYWMAFDELISNPYLAHQNSNEKRFLSYYLKFGRILSTSESKNKSNLTVMDKVSSRNQSSLYNHNNNGDANGFGFDNDNDSKFLESSVFQTDDGGDSNIKRKKKNISPLNKESCSSDVQQYSDGELKDLKQPLLHSNSPSLLSSSPYLYIHNDMNWKRGSGKLSAALGWVIYMWNLFVKVCAVSSALIKMVFQFVTFVLVEILWNFIKKVLKFILGTIMYVYFEALLTPFVSLLKTIWFMFHQIVFNIGLKIIKYTLILFLYTVILCPLITLFQICLLLLQARSMRCLIQRCVSLFSGVGFSLLYVDNLLRLIGDKMYPEHIQMFVY